jgi:chemotaxis protein histidine kinase CheA
MELDWKEGDILFAIIDHGVSINWKALEELARKRNWTPPPNANLSDIVFCDNASTVADTQVSQTSGCGIGMAAVAVKSIDIQWKHQGRVFQREDPASA